MESGAWIAAQVIAKRELSISHSLNSKGYETFVPTYSGRKKWSDRTKIVESALISGYVFIRQTSRIIHGPIVTTPGVIGIVGFGNRPALIDDVEIAQFRIVASSSLRAEPWPALEPGNPVKIARGPLAGIAGTVLHTRNKSLIIIAISLLNRFVSVRIDRSWLESGATNSLGLDVLGAAADM